MVHKLRLGLLPLLALGLLPRQAQSPVCSARCLYGRARAALGAGRYRQYLQYTRQLAGRAPDHPEVIYAVARGYALVGNPTAALDWLGRLARVGAARDLDSDSAFSTLRSSKRFLRIQVQLRANRVPTVHGRAAFALPDPNLVPEALARDPLTGDWLVGSLAQRKIVRLTQDGALRDFISDQDLLRVVGIHVDSARSLLWFATWAPRTRPPARGEAPPAKTRLFKCDLATGRVIQTYAPADSGGDHLFNDLAIAANGDVFVTDTDQGAVYRIRSGIDTLELFLPPALERFSDPNGIALSGDNRVLYVAFVEGVARVDLRTRAVTRLLVHGRGSAASIDGLYWYRGDLIGVQHLPGLQQVARYRLAPDGRAIQQVTVLDRADSLLRLPTTGAIVSNRFYYIANSQYDRLGSDNRLTPASQSPAPLTRVRVVDLGGH